MGSTLTADDIKGIIREVSRTISNNEDYLCKLDAEIGDGDHGTSMTKGFKAAVDDIDESEEDSGEVLQTVGQSLIKNIGGATGPLFASLFLGAGRACSGKQKVEVSNLASCFEEGLNQVKSRGGAKEGDKTMIDALKPAINGLREVGKDEPTPAEAFEEAYRRAEAGEEATEEMEPGQGRARYLGDRAIGHRDPGATSISLIFKAAYEYCKGQE